ncbi:hypothetical protein ACN47E_004520 [Coniothyrium glycines]
MANNYSQPFGYPYAYPPPQPQQQEEQQHAPPPNVFANIPGLQPAALPGINLTSHAQNSQQPPLPQGTSPWPQLPPDPNAWLHLFQQNGMIPPPPLPGLAFPSPSLPHTPQHVAFPPPFPPPNQLLMPHGKPHGATSASERIKEVMDSDREDGELSDRESSPSLADQLPPFREEAKQFVKLLHSHNIGYQVLAKEDLDTEQLRQMYQSLNLPSEPAPILPPKVNSTSSASLAVQPAVLTKPLPKAVVPVIKTTTVPAVSAQAAPSPTAPGDRKDYIARLQAAKKAKQAGGTKPSPAEQMQPAETVKPLPSAIAAQSVSTPSAKQPVTDEQRARNTELIKQRLQALRGKQKPALPDSSSTVSKPVSQADSGVSTPVRQAQTATLPGLPGIPALPGPPSSIPRKRTVPSDSADGSTSGGAVTPYTRPLGRSPHATHEEDDSMIIDVSDDESNGSEMDIDNDQTTQKPMITTLSGPNTPGPQTPSGQARNAELVEKEKQLAEMKLVLKRKFAEKREKQKAAAAAGTISTPQVLTPSVPVLPASAPFSQVPAQTLSNTRVGSVDAKRLRRAEIQSRLPSFDTETANNTSKIAQLTKEIEQLMAHNEQIAKDKALLIAELESLGVDTEGMSHAELQAKKHEIERETSPEKESLGQKDVVSQQSPKIQPSNVQVLAPKPPTSTTTKADAIQEVEPKASTTVQGHVPGGYASLPGLGAATRQPPESKSAPPSQNAQLGVSIPDMTATGGNGDAAATHHSMAPAVEFAEHPDTYLADTPLDDGEDFYSPPSADMDLDIAPPPADASVGVSNATPKSVSEDSELDMSESSEGELEEEEEYEPNEPMANADALSQAAQLHETATQSVNASQISTEDEETYEPPDVEEETSEMKSKDASAVKDVIPGPAEAGEGAMDIETSSDSSNDSDSDSEDDTTSEPDKDVATPANNLAENTANITDDIAPELQPELVTVPPVADLEEIVAKDENTSPRFTPYESPLRMFKSYRYHPSYAQDVAGGFLSWTYSHQIDPERVLCQYEASGGTCNDPECPNQHFRDIGITGEKLLVQLGTANPGKTPEEKQKWNDGLRGVLKELRTKNIKDPNGIAVEIANYRRQFLNDITRVVNL